MLFKSFWSDRGFSSKEVGKKEEFHVFFCNVEVSADIWFSQILKEVFSKWELLISHSFLLGMPMTLTLRFIFVCFCRVIYWSLMCKFSGLEVFFSCVDGLFSSWVSSGDLFLYSDKSIQEGMMVNIFSVLWWIASSLKKGCAAEKEGIFGAALLSLVVSLGVPYR